MFCISGAKRENIFASYIVKCYKDEYTNSSLHNFYDFVLTMLV